jgi:hypothetical protein
MVHQLDGLIDGPAEMMAIGDRDIERVAKQIDRAGGVRARDQRTEVVRDARVVRLDEMQAGPAFSDPPMRGRAGRADFLDGPIARRAADLRLIPPDGGIDQRELGDAVQLGSLLGVRQQHVQKGAQPSVPGFRVGGEPDDLPHAATAYSLGR